MSLGRGVEDGAVTACVVLYHPEPNVVSNVATYLPQTARLYKVEHTGRELSVPYRELVEGRTTTLVYADDHPGISRALNSAAEAARNDGFRWLLSAGLMSGSSSTSSMPIVNLLQACHFFLLRKAS